MSAWFLFANYPGQAASREIDQAFDETGDQSTTENLAFTFTLDATGYWVQWFSKADTEFFRRRLRELGVKFEERREGPEQPPEELLGWQIPY